MAVAQRCSLASFPVLRASGSTERLQSFGSGRKPFSALKQPRPRSLQEFQVDVRTPLGRGACSVVFAGTHRKTDFSVAIKAMSCAMPTERGALPVATGIANESQVFRHLLERTGGNSHPNVVELIGCFDGDGREASEMGLEVPQEERVHYFVTERLEGGSMDELLSPNGIPEDSARAVARKVCEGLASLHEQGVVHRDLKPGNVLFSKSDTGEAIPKLIDFSHAAVAKDGEESLRGELGTRGYVAPEVLAEKPYGSKCDVFSLGCVVHALLSGRPPRRCLRIGMVQQLPAAVSREARAFLARLLALNALERPSAQEALSEPWMKE